jgi:hypothetical protein
MSSPHVADHREYRSLPLHLPVQFAREGRAELIDCVTESISADEVCFVAAELIEQGERMELNVLLPLKKRSGNAVKMHLKCLVNVERVDPNQLGSGFRIGCRIRNYTVSFEDAYFRRDQVS